jgi:hypothetical protein
VQEPSFSDSGFGAAHERHLAGYRHSEIVVYCPNPLCSRFAEPTEVDYEEEYGQGWITPEDCWECKFSLVQEDPQKGEARV